MQNPTYIFKENWTIMSFPRSTIEFNNPWGPEEVIFETKAPALEMLRHRCNIIATRRAMFPDVAVNLFSLQIWEVEEGKESLLIEITHEDMPLPRSWTEELFSLEKHLRKIGFEE
jgi:hypothetical protein